MNDQTKKKKVQTFMTPKGRVAFANVFTPKQIMNKGEPVYSMTLIFDPEAQKSEEYQKMYAAAKAAAQKKFPDGMPPNFKNPFRKCEEKPNLQGYEAGHVFINVKSKFKPGVVNEAVQDIISEEEFYSGCYARASLTVYAYDNMGNKGVSFGLNNIQKLGDGEAFSGRKSAADEFSAVEGFNADADGFGDDFGDAAGGDDFGM